MDACSWFSIGSILAGSVGAAATWTVLNFVGIPARKFIDLRGEVVRRLVEFANVRSRWKEVRDDVGATSGERDEIKLSDREIARLEEAQRVLRDLAAQMRAFATNETMAMWVVRWILRFNPEKASAGLIGLSNDYDTSGGRKAFHRSAVHEALRIKL